jgi:hypothetical protein
VYGTPLGAGQLDAVANVPGTFTYIPAAGSILGAGSGQTLSVTFTPQDATDYTAAGATTTITVAKLAPSLVLASSGGASVYGQPVSFVATVGALAGTPSGTVTFFDGTTPLATVALGQSGTATFTTSTLIAGAHSITASYSGDADVLGAQSAPYSETVARTGTEVIVIQNSIFKKKKLISVRLTAKINPLAPGGGVPTGVVTFELVTKTKKKVKVTALGSGAVIGGEASLTLMANKVLHQAITVVYGGDANDNASNVTTPEVT